MQPVRLAAAALLSVACGGLILYSGCVRDARVGHAPAAAWRTGAAGDAEWINVVETPARQTAHRIVERASVGWRAAGMSETDVEGVSSVAVDVLIAVVHADFDTYLALTRRLQLAPAPIADRLLEQYARWGLYPELSEEPLRSAPPLDRLRHAWERPSRRHMDIARVDLVSVEAGRGLVLDTITWPYPGTLAQFSVFQRAEGELSVAEGNAIEREGSSGFITFAAETGSGFQAHLRFNFYRDIKSGRWIPLSIVTGTEPGPGKRALLPLL